MKQKKKPGKFYESLHLGTPTTVTLPLLVVTVAGFLKYNSFPEQRSGCVVSTE
jgi:hypothetical protein